MRDLSFNDRVAGIEVAWLGWIKIELPTVAMNWEDSPLLLNALQRLSKPLKNLIIGKVVVVVQVVHPIARSVFPCLMATGVATVLVLPVALMELPFGMGKREDQRVIHHRLVDLNDVLPALEGLVIHALAAGDQRRSLDGRSDDGYPHPSLQMVPTIEYFPISSSTACNTPG